MLFIKNIIKNIVPHLLFILSGIFIFLLILDGYNPTMNFLDNPISTKLLWFFCIITILYAFITILLNRKDLNDQLMNKDK